MSQYSGHSHHLWGTRGEFHESYDHHHPMSHVMLLLLERNWLKGWDSLRGDHLILFSCQPLALSADDQNTWRCVYNCQGSAFVTKHLSSL